MQLNVLILFSAIFAHSFAVDVSPTWNTEWTTIETQLKLALKEMVDIIDENKMNVSVIVNEANRWSNGEMKEDVEIAVRMPPYTEKITETKLTENKIKNWMQMVDKLPDILDAVAATRTVTINYGNNETMHKEETKKMSLPVLHESIITVKDGEQGFVVDTPNQATYYNMLDSNSKLKMQLAVAHVKTEIIKKSDAMPQAVLTEVEKELPKLFAATDSTRISARALELFMNKPGATKWRALVDGEDVFVPTNKWALLKIANVRYMIFALE